MPTRVPVTIQNFNDYIINTTAYLLEESDSGGGVMEANWERLGLSAARKNGWVAFRNEWRDDLYPAYSQKEESRTTAITKQVQELMKNFRIFTRPILNMIAGGENTTIDDLLMFNIKAGPLRDNTATPKPAITTQPYPEMQPMGGGMVKITVREQSDASRASMHPDADSIEMAYHIGTNPPASPTTGTKLKVYSGALHTFNAGVDNTTKRLYAYFRWNNTSDSSKSDPYSDMVQVVIA